MNNNDVMSFYERLNESGLNGEIDFQSEIKLNRSFGTAGIRGMYGQNQKNINAIVIATATSSLSKLISTKRDKDAGIVIAYDNRKYGYEYARTASKVLNSAGIKTFLYENQILATPILSYLIRMKGAFGGINITASHNPKEYNGYKLYDHTGAQMLGKQTDMISNVIKDIDIKNIDVSKYSPDLLDPSLIDQYVNDITSGYLGKESDLTVAYSPLRGTGYIVSEKIFKKLNIKYHLVNKEYEPSTSFKNVQNPNPENIKAYKNTLAIAKRNKSDIGIVTDPDADRVGVIVRHKKRYKYMSGNDIASVYTEYILNKMFNNGGIPKDSYIVKSYVSTDLVTKIAKKYGVRVIDVPVGFKNIANVIQEEKGNFIFAFEESYGFLMKKEVARDKDAFQGMVNIIEMASLFKSLNSSIFLELRKIQNEYNIYRNIQLSKELDLDLLPKVLKKIKRTKQIGGEKVSKIIDFRNSETNPHNSIKLELNDGSFVVVRPSGTEPKIKYYIQAINTRSEQLVKERMIIDFVNGVSEDFPDKKITRKGIAKYSLFAIIMIALLFFTFKFIYGNFKSTSSSIWSSSFSFKHSIEVWTIFLGVIAIFFRISVDAWMKYRLLRFNGQKVKVRQLILSSIMGSIISYITPLAIGGDAIGYWYLRRKGFKRGPLASTFLTATILWQVKNVILTAIFVPMGMHMFKDIFTDGSAASKSVMSLFTIGLTWDIVSTIILWTMMFSERIQSFTIRMTVKFMEWFKYTNIQDPFGKTSSTQYEFYMMRSSFKKIWKSPKILSESMIYELLPKLVPLISISYMSMGIVRDDLQYGQYFSQIIAQDIINTANSISLTPGSTGFSEFISINIREHIYIKAAPGESTKDTAIFIDVIWKTLQEWPYLILSTLTSLVVILGETRNKKKKTKNIITGKVHTTTVYKKTAFIWPLFFAGWATLILLI